VQDSLTQTIGDIKSELENTDKDLFDNLSDLTDRTATLETRTKYFDASENDYFAIVDSNGNIGMKIDGSGVVAHNYYIQTKDETNGNPTRPLIGY
jgi:hypothetical protein